MRNVTSHHSFSLLWLFWFLQLLSLDNFQLDNLIIFTIFTIFTIFIIFFIYFISIGITTQKGSVNSKLTQTDWVTDITSGASYDALKAKKRVVAQWEHWAHPFVRPDRLCNENGCHLKNQNHIILLYNDLKSKLWMQSMPQMKFDCNLRWDWTTFKYVSPDSSDHSLTLSTPFNVVATSFKIIHWKINFLLCKRICYMSLPPVRGIFTIYLSNTS